MWVSHETIYQALYVRPAVSWREQVEAALRTGRTRRQTPGPASRRPKLKGMVNISERPAEADDRAVPGHWEGDLILGAAAGPRSAPWSSAPPGSCCCCTCPTTTPPPPSPTAMSAAIGRAPRAAAPSLTWDQGSEMALHTKITAATGLPIYFCDPHSPWQRGSNENTNGLLRQYFPKGTDLSFYGPGLLDQVAAELNARPRKRLDWKPRPKHSNDYYPNQPNLLHRQLESKTPRRSWSVRSLSASQVPPAARRPLPRWPPALP